MNLAEQNRDFFNNNYKKDSDGKLVDGANEVRFNEVVALEWVRDIEYPLGMDSVDPTIEVVFIDNSKLRVGNPAQVVFGMTFQIEA